MQANDLKTDVIETKDAIITNNQSVGVRRINQYQVFEHIGRGMHGKVRRGIDTHTGEQVVRLRLSFEPFVGSP